MAEEIYCIYDSNTQLSHSDSGADSREREEVKEESSLRNGLTCIHSHKEKQRELCQVNESEKDAD